MPLLFHALSVTLLAIGGIPSGAIEGTVSVRGGSGRIDSPINITIIAYSDPVQSNRRSSEVTAPPQFTVRTDKNGRFHIAVPNGRYVVCAEAADSHVVGNCTWGATVPTAMVTDGTVTTVNLSLQAATRVVLSVSNNKGAPADRISFGVGLLGDEGRYARASFLGRSEDGRWLYGASVPQGARVSVLIPGAFVPPQPEGSLSRQSVDRVWVDTSLPDVVVPIDRP